MRLGALALVAMVVSGCAIGGPTPVDGGTVRRDTGSAPADAASQPEASVEMDAVDVQTPVGEAGPDVIAVPDDGPALPVDSAPEAGNERGPEAAVDVRTDAPPDVAPDARPDAAPEPGPEAGSDVISDRPADTGASCTDMDRDGYGVGAGCFGPDCNDSNPNVHPGVFETCNGLDDDCNGQTDEGLGVTTCGAGACRVTQPACMGGRLTLCMPGTPGTESCNGVDDDCDGMTDEGLPDLRCGTGACATTAPACRAGRPNVCVPPMGTAERCNGIDDDCDAMTDEDLGTVSCGVGACARTVAACVDGIPGLCTPGTGSPESCNGLDDDCNGMTDERIAVQTCGVGRCRTTAPGCTGGTVPACVPLMPAAETCNLVDDDCNGMTDDAIADQVCGVGACRRTAAGCTAGTVPRCTPGTPTPEVCNSLDDDCNGRPDDNNVCLIPTNDRPATPQVISLLPSGQVTRVSGDTTYATDALPSCRAGKDVYYRIDLAQPAVLYVDAIGSSFDVVLGFSDASGAVDPSYCSASACAGANGGQLAETFPAGPVYFVVDGDAGASGAFSLSIQWLPSGGRTQSVPNPSVGGWSVPSNETNLGTANVTGNCNSQGGDVLYYWTTCPSTGGRVRATTCVSNATMDTVLEAQHGDLAVPTPPTCSGPAGCSLSTHATVLSFDVGATAALHGVYVGGTSATSGTYFFGLLPY